MNEQNNRQEAIDWIIANIKGIVSINPTRNNIKVGTRNFAISATKLNELKKAIGCSDIWVSLPHGDEFCTLMYDFNFDNE